MSCSNLYKLNIQNAIHFFLDIFKATESNSRTLTDDQMECMQFGICSFIPKTLEEISYFHF